MHDELDPDVLSFLDELALLEAKPLHLISTDAAREQQLRAIRLGQGPEWDLVTRVSDAVVAGVPVRIFEMELDRPSTVVVLVHGGGWVLGDLDGAEWSARSIAATLGCTVVSVGYRLAPENPYPAGLDDCRSVLAYISKRYQNTKIAIAGDSAGANLALALGAASVGNDSLRVDAQLLLYPAIDPNQASASHDRYADGHVLTTEAMQWFWEQYLTGAGRPYQPTPLAGMPPTIVTTAGFDPLQDEGRELARCLVEASVSTVFVHHGNLTHGWLDAAGTIPAARRARAEVLALLATLLAGPTELSA